MADGRMPNQVLGMDRERQISGGDGPYEIDRGVIDADARIAHRWWRRCFREKFRVLKHEEFAKK
jgi:hypothetical protein